MSGTHCGKLAETLTGGSESRHVNTRFVALSIENALHYIRVIQSFSSVFIYKHKSLTGLLIA
jgi:hypothetical protein